MEPIRGNQKGFTLLEMLIAVTLLAIGLLAVAAMQTTAIGSNGFANRHTALTATAQVVMEDIVSWKNDDLRLQTAAANVSYALARPTIAGVGTMTAKYSITPNDPVAKVSKIDVTITLTPGNKTIYLTSYKRVQ